MSGHVHKKGTSWYVVLEDRDNTGKRTPKWIGVRKYLGLNKRATKKQADDLLVKLLSEKQRGVYIDPATDTVSDFMDSWMESYVIPNTRQKTAESYADNIRLHIKPDIGGITLDKLRPADLHTLYAKLLREGRTDGKGGLSHRTVRYCHTIIKEALAHAVKWELVIRNVADAIDPPKSQTKKREPWTDDQADTFAQVITGHRLAALFLLAICTGMRRGELLGLRWADIDLSRPAISITQSVTTGKDGLIFGSPKTDTSRRTIPIPRQMAVILAEHRKKQVIDFVALGIRDTDKKDLVFVSERGTPINPPNLHRLFSRLCAAAGVPRISIHDLRHTYATSQLRMGANMKIIQELLGHANWSTTANIYTHIAPDIMTAAVDAFGERFFGGEKTERKSQNE